MRRFFAPTVIQTSQMDCGPAVLQSVLAGYGIASSYGRLRELCLTQIDGTSISELESVLNHYGLQTEQVILPIDHLFLTHQQNLPAIVITILPGGGLHFMVIWRRVGKWFMVMNPAHGFQWMRASAIARDLFTYTHEMPIDEWKDEWAHTEEFTSGLAERLMALKVGAVTIERWINEALTADSWGAIASLDAASRLATDLYRARAITRPAQIESVMEHILKDPMTRIPPTYWTVKSASATTLRLNGTVVLRIVGKADTRAPSDEAHPPNRERPQRELLRALLLDGWAQPLALVLAGIASTALFLMETLVLRALIALLNLPTTWSAIYIFFVMGALLRFSLMAGTLRLGRRLDIHLRLAFFKKLPRLADPYFRSRLPSDMVQRSYLLDYLRQLPALINQMLQTILMIVFIGVGLIWLNPTSGFLVMFMVMIALLLPYMGYRAFIDGDLQLQTHAAAMNTPYTDAMRGILPVQAHRIQATMLGEYDYHRHKWGQIRWTLAYQQILLRMIILLIGQGFLAVLVVQYLAIQPESAGVFIIVYWSQVLFFRATSLIEQLRRYTTFINITLRLLEPLTAPEETPPAIMPDLPATIAITMVAVNLQVAGHPVLKDIHLTIHAGEHVAIIGASGAGKSSLLGLLLGWYPTYEGHITINDQPLTMETSAWLRRGIVWIDPSVQLWNQSLADNVWFGNDKKDPNRLAQALSKAYLDGVVARLTYGIHTALGENGGRLSGGEGQRVRFGRGLLHDTPRLVLLDEPFRGLPRKMRLTLYQEARHLWRDTTLLCATHDLETTQHFPRVVIIENGQVVADGDPLQMQQDPSSPYSRALQAQHDRQKYHQTWRQWHLRDGVLIEEQS